MFKYRQKSENFNRTTSKTVFYMRSMFQLKFVENYTKRESFILFRINAYSNIVRDFETIHGPIYSKLLSNYI